jgi:7-carboxy-7-deazaguanine synthase
MRIAEIFYSVQGEGSLVGMPSIFVRTSGCNLRCTWCDTPYTSWHPEGEDLTVAQILERTAEYTAARHVVLTGGEPMIAPGIAELSCRFRERGMHITIETAGTVFNELACDLMSISPKLSNSTPEGTFAAQHERLRIQPEVLRRLISAYRYQLKFVITDERSIEEARELVQTLQAPASNVILMPEGVSDEVLKNRATWLAQVCMQYGYRFSPRLHIELYGNRRGV